MNKQLQEFVDLAERHARNKISATGEKKFSQFFNEKFAELIVRECAKEACTFWSKQLDNSEESAQHHILNHFGVKQ